MERHNDWRNNLERTGPPQGGAYRMLGFARPSGRRCEELGFASPLRHKVKSRI